MVKVFSRASGQEVPYKIVDSRLGDIGMCYADAIRDNVELEWEDKYGIEDMCKDSWTWQSNNQNGYTCELDKVVLATE